MQKPVPKVQVRPLIVTVLLALLLPVGLAFAVDALLNTAPVVAVVVSVICIPLASLLVINRTLREMKALIAVVAPEVAEAPPADPAAGEPEANQAAPNAAPLENEPAKQHKATNDV